MRKTCHCTASSQTAMASISARPCLSRSISPRIQQHQCRAFHLRPSMKSPLSQRVRADAKDAGSDSSQSVQASEKTKVPAWAQPDSTEQPPWARSEAKSPSDKPFELPFWVLLLFSTFVAIAAVGSIFEYTEGNPLFGVIPPDNFLWAPILLFFAITGFPTSGYLLYLAIQAANKAAAEADKEDGY